MARTLIVSDRQNSFFTTNNIKVGTQIPTEGEYSKGDIVVNIGNNTASEAMWICVKSGNPGTWEVVGAGAGGGSGSIISVNDSVFVDEAVTEVSLLGLGGVVASKDKLIVHFNSTHLMEGVDYEISENGTKIVKLGEGKWNESNEAGALFAFELFKQVESIDGNNISIDSKLTTITNHVILNGPMHEVEIGINGFNKDSDMLMVFKNSTFMVEGVDYTISEGGSMIVSTGGEVWNESNVEDFGITFVVFKEVAIYEGGGITLDMLGSDVHGALNDIISMATTNAANIAKNTEAIENFDLSDYATKEDLENVEVDLSPYQEKTDNGLQTTDKTIIGAINEVFQSGNNVKQNLVDALIAKGVSCSTSDSFSKLISLIYGLTNNVGGGDGSDSNLPIFEGDNTTAECTNITTNRTNASAAVVDKKIYVVGGENSTAITSVECYDTETGLWENIESLPYPRTKHVTEAVGVNIYAIGGHDGSNVESGVFVYDTYMTKTWTALTSAMSMPLGTQSSASAVVGNKIYVLGGVDVTGTQRDEVYIFDTTNNSWSYGTDWDYGHQMAGATAIGDKIYCVSGTYYRNSSSLKNNIIRCYDTITNTWSNVSTLSYSANSPAVEAYDGKVYISGGLTNSAIENKISCYNPNDNTIEVLNTMITNRCRHASAVVDGIIYYIAGSGDGASILNSVEAYCPPGVEVSIGGGSATSSGIIIAAELPESADEGQLCIITDTEPVKVTFNYNKPSLIESEIFVNCYTEPSFQEYVINNGITSVKFNIRHIVQLIDGKEKTIYGYIYLGGIWTPLIPTEWYLFKEGKGTDNSVTYSTSIDRSGINTSETNGWVDATSTIERLMMRYYSAAACSVAAYTDFTKVNLTGYNYLHVNFSANTAGARWDLAGLGFEIQIRDTAGNVVLNQPYTFTDSTGNGAFKIDETTCKLNVSSLEGEYTIRLKGTCSNTLSNGVTVYIYVYNLALGDSVLA